MKIISNTEDNLVIRLDKGDNLIEKLKEVISSEGIMGACFRGIGACSKVILSYFDLDKKEYLERTFDENLEIVSLSGNIALAEEDIIIHAHGVFANGNYSTIGGHIMEMIVSVTCEIALTKLKDSLSRQINQDFGLKLLD
jgi:predicted DNA-binding protein with PD1-like motif